MLYPYVALSRSDCPFSRTIAVIVSSSSYSLPITLVFSFETIAFSVLISMLEILATRFTDSFFSVEVILPSSVVVPASAEEVPSGNIPLTDSAVARYVAVMPDAKNTHAKTEIAALRQPSLLFPFE